jgi:hypothetical protein
MCHACTHRFHHPGSLHAELLRKRHGVQATALVNINEVQANCVVPNADLAWTGLADRHVYQRQLFGTAMLIDTNGTGKTVCHGSIQKSERQTQMLPRKHNPRLNHSLTRLQTTGTIICVPVPKTARYCQNARLTCT